MTDTLFPGATELEGRAIREISAVAMDAPAAANSGHSGTAMALAPLGVTLWGRVMRHDPTDPGWSDRDRFIMSNGHACILQYAPRPRVRLRPDGRRPARLSPAPLAHARTPRARRRSHGRSHDRVRSVRASPTASAWPSPSGSCAVTTAATSSITAPGSSPVTAASKKGVSHEAASLAGSLGLDHLTIFYDNNHITIDGATELAFHDDTAERFAAYGWQVINLGEKANDLDALEGAMREAIAETARPTLIIVRSHIAFPSPEMMDTPRSPRQPFQGGRHHARPRRSSACPTMPFTFDPDLPDQMVATLTGQREARMAWESRVTAAGATGAQAARTAR